MSLKTHQPELRRTASKLCQLNKGILAADESNPTMKKRFDLFNIENTFKNRMNYRKLLFTTPNLNQYISGIIINEDTLSNIQIDSEYNDLYNIIVNQNDMIIGCKLDQGLTELFGGHGIDKQSIKYSHVGYETFTKGIDTLYERALKSYENGVEFAKFRTQIKIPANSQPSSLAIAQCAWQLSLFARTVQEAGLVAMMEPDVLMCGSHNIDTTYSIQKEIYNQLFHNLIHMNVFLDGCILKPAFTLAGTDWAWMNKEDPGDRRVRSINNAHYTLNTLSSTVPPSIPGIFFLSGGLSEEESSIQLSTLNAVKKIEQAPWHLSFSFGRALQQSALRQWACGMLQESEKWRQDKDMINDDKSSSSSSNKSTAYDVNQCTSDVNNDYAKAMASAKPTSTLLSPSEVDCQQMLLARARANSKACAGLYRAGTEPSVFLPIEY